MASTHQDLEAGYLRTSLSEKAKSNFVFSNITCTVAEGKQILSGVTGHAQAGDLVALMGSSGCGKTTLLNILARRSQGMQVTGDMTLNGTTLTTSQLRSASTYVEQEDALIGSLTVAESIDYAARLSLTKISKQERKARVEETLHAFGLSAVRNVKIGTPLQKGCSGGQKRRVSIASQLITMPDIVFLDEPTSGLDSAASFEVCSKLKNIAQVNGILIIASIHQPSTATFNLFSKVLLLSRGKQLYFGPSKGIEQYFSKTDFPVPTAYNPADHILDISNIDFHKDSETGMAHITKLSDIWTHSEEAVDMNAELLALQRASDKSSSALNSNSSDRSSKAHTHAKPSTLQCTVILLNRSGLKAIRDPLAYGVRLIMYLGLAIMMGTVWLRLSPTQNHIKEYITALFFGSAFMSFMAVAYIPAYLEDYFSYIKERRNGMYGPLPFLLSNILVSVPFLYLISITFSLITYFMVNFRHSATGFFQYSMWLFLDLLAAESLVVLISTLVPLFVAALAITAFANGLWMSVGGFLVAQDVLNVFWYYTFYQIDYQRYVFDGLMRNEFLFRAYDCGPGCDCSIASSLAPQCQIAGEAVLDQYGLSGSFNPGVYVAILLAITIVMRMITYVILRLKK